MLATSGEDRSVLSMGAREVRWTKVPDVELVRLAREGEDAAFSELWRRYLAMSQRVAHRIVRNREDAEDVAQDALMRAYVHLGSFDGRSSFSTWLTQITINSSLMLLRRRRTRNEISLDADPDYSAWIYGQVVDPAENPERAFSERQMTGMLYRAIDRLPAKLRVAMLIRHAEELPVKEVAEKTGISVAAAKSRLNRASRSIELSMKRRMAARVLGSRVQGPEGG